MGVQYTAAPKYPVFTGYIVSEDTPFYTFLFGMHEVGYLWTAWMFYGPIISVSSMFGGQLSLILSSMKEELKTLSIKTFQTKQGNFSGHSEHFRQSHSRESASSLFGSETNDYTRRRYISLDEFLRDYIKLMVYMERLNEFCSYKFLFVHITAYIQMIGDVFIMILW